MHRLWIIFASLICLSVARAEGERRDVAAAPAERFQALLKESRDAPDDLSKAVAAEDRTQVQARLATLPQRFLALAQENPSDAVAVDALLELVAGANSSIFPLGGNDSPDGKALALLGREYVRSEKLGIACQRVLFGFRQSHEDFLRSVLAMNPHPEVQSLACLSLAQFLMDRMNRLELLPEQPELAERYHRAFGKDYIDQLQRQDRAAVAGEAEALFQRAANEHPEVKIPVTYFGSGGTVGEKAAAELFQIRHLAVGKVAPDIEGEDQDGKPFKLSDYRGKVVLLDFWNRL